MPHRAFAVPQSHDAASLAERPQRYGYTQERWIVDLQRSVHLFKLCRLNESTTKHSQPGSTQGTRSYRQRFPKVPFTSTHLPLLSLHSMCVCVWQLTVFLDPSPKSRFQLVTSRVGFGCYRVQVGFSQHQRALFVSNPLEPR